MDSPNTLGLGVTHLDLSISHQGSSFSASCLVSSLYPNAFKPSVVESFLLAWPLEALAQSGQMSGIIDEEIPELD